MIELNPTQRRALRAHAHHLNPVVMIGNGGLSEAVSKEIGVALKAHELIKIKMAGDDRAAREIVLAQICEQHQAAPVQHIGKILVVYKPADPPRIELPK